MLVKPIVIDLGWGDLKSALVKLPDSDFVAPQNSATQRRALVNQYVDAFRKVEVASYSDAKNALKDLAAQVSACVVAEKQAALNASVEAQISKLP